MMHVDLDQTAELTLWPGHVPTRAAEMRSFPTLRAALDAAAEAIDGQDAIPWIITDGGDILAPKAMLNPAAKLPVAIQPPRAAGGGREAL
ncbi:hypothetical protein QDS91_30360 [Methylobacterium brachiatum]|nr:hypothetical protein [Methylobacterium brachiatum]MDH2313906.1 hypothetical protein [Methylobacterium brachiatum]